MLWQEEAYGAVKPQAIIIVSALINLFIPHGSGLPAVQLFLRRMVVSPLGITRLITVLICV